MSDAFAPTALRNHDAKRIRALVLVLFVSRLLAVGSEQFGLPELSRQTAAIMLAVMALIYLVEGQFARVLSLFNVGLLVWILAALMSAVGAKVADPLAAVSLCLVLGFYLLFFNLLWTRFDGDHGLATLRRMFLAFMVLGLVLSAVQIVAGTGFVDPGKPDIRRVFGADVHPVSYGLQLVTGMAGLAVVSLKRRQRLPYGLIVLGCVALYLTYARTAWGMMALVILAYGFSAASLRGRVAIVALVTIGGLLLANTSHRFEDLTSLPTFLASFDFSNPVFDYRAVDNSLNWRVVNWAFGVQQSGDALMFGHGPGQSAVVSLFHLEMHNILLEALFELGVPGLVAVLLVLAGLFRVHRQLSAPMTKAQRQANALANAVGLGLLVSVLISTSLVDQLTTVMLYFMLLRAAMIGQVRGALPE